MQYLTLDSIVRSVLLKKGATLHSYIEMLSYAAAGLKKLNIHTLKNINSVKLPVSDYLSATLPCDYIDYVRVGFAVGERVRPLILDETLNRLNNYDSSGAKIPYTPVFPDGEVAYNEDDLTLYNQYGTDGDALFGHDTSRSDWRFNVIRERNEIQLSADFPYDYIILDYISDGLSSDAATQVNSLAQEALEKFILWQSLVHKRSAGDGERREAERRFNDEHRLLRAALNPLTGADIIHALRSGYTGLYRN